MFPALFDVYLKDNCADVYFSTKNNRLVSGIYL